jgi:hypothetical protein
MSNVEFYVDKWFELLNYCQQITFDSKIFKQKHDEYAKRWAKQDLIEQGEICNIIYKRLQE